MGLELVCLACIRLRSNLSKIQVKDDFSTLLFQSPSVVVYCCGKQESRLGLSFYIESAWSLAASPRDKRSRDNAATEPFTSGENALRNTYNQWLSHANLDMKKICLYSER